MKAGDSAGVRVPAPIYFVVAIVVGTFLHSIWPALLPAHWGFRSAGVVLVFMGTIASTLAAREFARAGTALRPDRPSTMLVARGPFAWSRNPIYLSLAVIQAGIAIWSRNGWLLVTLAIAWPVVDLLVVTREERYLNRLFGTPYESYCAQVRRWI